MKAFLTFVLCTFCVLAGTAQIADTVTKVQMTNTEFNQFTKTWAEDLKSLNAQTATDMRERLVTTASYFSTAQVKKLLSLIERDSGKLGLARLLYSRVTDKDNYIQLAGLLNLGNYRDEFMIWYNDPDKS